MRRSTVGIIIFILVAIGLLGFWRFQEPSPSETSNPNLQTYHSNMLDIAFQYNPSDTNILEKGDTVYVYSTGTPALEGQWIKHFSKLEKETFAQSIERQILSGFSTSTCTVQISQHDNFTQAEIMYPEPEDATAPFWQNAPQCNEAYDKTNGIRYFLYDPAHLDRFYFLSIGQYPIIATGTKTWQDTLTIED